MDWLIHFIITKIYQTPILLTFFKFYKYLFRLTTNSTELYRICHQAAKDLPWIMEVNEEEEDNETKEDETIPLLETTNKINNELEKVTQSILKINKEYEYVPADIVFKIDRSILYSSQLTVERRKLEENDCIINDITKDILIKKRFPGTIKSPAARVLKACLKKIVATNQLTLEINENAQTKYDCTNPIHEQKLLRLWTNLMPNVKLESRLTKQWAEIGFQGNDPASDFRGMGIQGLDDLIYFTKTYPEASQRSFLHSQHPISWYPFAIVGINISQFTIQILRTRQLQYYLFKHGITKDIYQDLYCYFYYTFNEYWNSFENPRLTVMDFERVFKQYKQIIQTTIFKNDLIPLSIYLEQQQHNDEELMNEKESTTTYQRVPHKLND